MKIRPSAIQREIKQSRAFVDRRAKVAVALLRTADLVRRRVSQVIEPHGITAQQYNVLRILRGARPESLPTLEIAERMVEQAPGITRLLDRLEAKRLVARERCRHDRRRVLCSITPTGLDLLRRLDPPVRNADTGGLRRLEGDQMDQLLRLLDIVREGSV